MLMRDNITYSTPGYEVDALAYTLDDSPLTLGETGAGLFVDPSLCGDGFPRKECPNGDRCASRS